MKDYGIIESTVKPKKIEIDSESVYENTDIEEFENDGMKYYCFRQVRYSKDEYILQVQELKREIINTQLAICELYERGV